MHKTTVQFATLTKNKEVKRVGKSVIFQPKTDYKGGSIKWFDDSKLIKKEEGAEK